MNINSQVFENYSYENKNNNQCIYYGSYRDDRKKYFKKYLNGMLVSTHSKNRPKIDALEVQPSYLDRLNIQKGDLAQFGYSLYIEDEKTHHAYNYLANRFYESLNSNTICLFDESCENTLSLSNYPIDKNLVISNKNDLANATLCKKTWNKEVFTKAAQDRIKKWEDEVTSPNFLYGQVPMIRQFQTQQANVPPTPPTKPDEKGKSTAQTAPLPFRSGSTFDVGQPGTVTIPTAPRQQVQISPATIAIIVEAYRKDPNAVFNGRKAVEILSTLKSRGYEIPGMIVTPGAQDTGQIR
jgi:hypothetical protein